MNPLENTDAERAIISALSTVSVAEPSAALDLLESLRIQADDFASRAHADVFAAASDLLRRGIPLELFALEAALEPSPAVKRAGGRAWLVPLVMDPAAKTGSVAEYARLVRNAALRRRIVAHAKAAALQARDATVDPNEALAGLVAALGTLSKRDAELHTAEADTLRLSEQLAAARSGVRELVLSSGIRALDQEIGGLQPAVLTLIGALPGVGKSALLATITRNLAIAGRKVGLFSLEDERMWVVKRMAAIEAGVAVFAIGTRPLSDSENARVAEALPVVYRTLERVVIDDRQALSPLEIVQAAREMVLNHGCQAILIDHLGEVRLSRSERYDLDIAEALSAFRDFAKRHHVPVVVASHVRRRTGLELTDAPFLTDFANSSAPERMARVALGLSKPFDGCLRVSVLKQTNGCAGQAIDLALVKHAAMVDNEQEALAPEAT